LGRPNALSCSLAPIKAGPGTTSLKKTVTGEDGRKAGGLQAGKGGNETAAHSCGANKLHSEKKKSRTSAIVLPQKGTDHAGVRSSRHPQILGTKEGDGGQN